MHLLRTVILERLAISIFGFGQRRKTPFEYGAHWRRSGAPVSQLSPSDLSSVGVVFQIGLAPRRIDILTSISGVKFEIAWHNRMTLEMDGMEVQVIGRSDLLVNKRASGRPKDLADAATLDPTGGQ